MLVVIDRSFMPDLVLAKAVSGMIVPPFIAIQCGWRFSVAIDRIAWVIHCP